MAFESFLSKVKILIWLKNSKNSMAYLVARLFSSFHKLAPCKNLHSRSLVDQHFHVHSSRMKMQRTNQETSYITDVLLYPNGQCPGLWVDKLARNCLPFDWSLFHPVTPVNHTYRTLVVHTHVIACTAGTQHVLMCLRARNDCTHTRTFIHIHVQYTAMHITSDS